MKVKKSTIMNMVRILAVRPLEPTSNSPQNLEGGVLGKRMHRILSEKTFYKLYSNVDIGEDIVSIGLSVSQEIFDVNQTANHTVHVNISAIVGENGSGKSTIIDYIIRIINNLSAVLFGELYNTISSEHLHFIHDVYAELYMLVDDIVYRISCEGDVISIFKYKYKETIDKKAVYYINKTPIRFPIDSNKPHERDDVHIGLLSKFCYTMIVNYSLYSFDTSSYKGELTKETKEIQINKEGLRQRYTTNNYEEIKKSKNENECVEARSWLTGIMNKQDGYRVPLLITPTRHKGQVDQRREYVRGKEKLLSLVLLRNEKGRTFTKINNKETIDIVTLQPNPKFLSQTYMSIFDDILPKLSESLRLALFNLVKNILTNKFNISEHNNDDTKIIWYYIVHKFFKIVMTYSEYSEYRELLQNCSNRLNTHTILGIKDAVNIVCNNHSHVTKLFWRSIFHLIYNIPETIAKEEQFENLFENGISIDKYSEKAYELKKHNSEIQSVDELLPPPIFNIDFKLYSSGDKKNTILFETLSSGEKQITLSLSTIFYYLINIGFTANNGPNSKKGKRSTINYRHVCVILDELELYFHPEMQRTFISRLLYGLKQINLNNITSIHFIFATHSPFILSDIPRSNVLFLDKKGKPKNNDTMHTFGANIHTMLEHSFFLEDGTMGAFAKKVIGEIETCLKIHKIIIEKGIKDNSYLKEIKDKEEYDFLKFVFDKRVLNQEKFKSTYSKERIRATIELFDEPLIKRVLLKDYYEVFPKEKDKEDLIYNLEKQLDLVKKASEAYDKPFDNIISKIKNKINSLKNEK